LKRQQEKPISLRKQTNEERKTNKQGKTTEKEQKQKQKQNTETSTSPS
jgi:hypothetical protein